MPEPTGRNHKSQNASRGQAAVEYVILLSVLIIALIGSVLLFPQALESYYGNIASVICSPLP